MLFGFLFTLRCLKTPSAKAIVTHQYEGLKIKCDTNFEYHSNPTRIHFGGQSAHSSIRLLAPIDSPVRSLAPIDRGTRTNKAANHVHRPHPSALRHLFETLCLLIQNKK